MCVFVFGFVFVLSFSDGVQSKINFLVGPQELRLATVKRRKLLRFGHVTRRDHLFQNHPSGHLGGRGGADTVVGRKT